MNLQEIAVYGLFLAAIVYFGFRFYRKNIKKKVATESNSPGCNSGSCGCS